MRMTSGMKTAGTKLPITDIALNVILGSLGQAGQKFPVRICTAPLLQQLRIIQIRIGFILRRTGRNLARGGEIFKPN